MSDMKVKFAASFDGLRGISHGFFGRSGGVSGGIYASLNAGQGADDNPAHIEENRTRVAAAIGTTGPRLLSCHQCHSTDVMIIDKPWEGARPKADAIVTRTPGIAISALAADCAPVLFYDPIAKVIGAAHAGWRGALAGVTDETVKAMLTLGAHRAHIRAAIGPCIGPDNFEVGPEFVAEFIGDSLGNGKFFRPGTGTRSYFDMKAYLVRKLNRAGVKTTAALPDCTYAQNDAYFSYRHNSHHGIPDYGRNISVIMLTE